MFFYAKKVSHNPQRKHAVDGSVKSLLLLYYLAIKSKLAVKTAEAGSKDVHTLHSCHIICADKVVIMVCGEF